MPSPFIRALAVCAAIALPVVARAGAPFFPSFPNGDGLVLNGTAQIVNDRLRLTEPVVGSVGAAWWSEPVSLAQGFTTEFRYDMHGGDGADGIAFVIQTVGSSALGGAGGGLGATEIGKGAFVALRSYVHNRIVIGASETEMDPTAKPPLASISANVRGKHHVRIVYVRPPAQGDGGAGIEVTFDGGAPFFAPIDLGNFNGTSLLNKDGTAFIGLTAATGDSIDNHDILAWAVNQPLPPPPPLQKAGAYTLRNGRGDPAGNLLCAIDPETAEVLDSRQVTLPGAAVDQATGLARHPMTGEFYAVLRVQETGRGGSERSLVTLDRATARATLIGSLGEPFAGITFLPDGTLLGVTGEDASNPEAIYEIDPETAQTVRVVACASGDTGETLVATPEGFVYRASGEGYNDDAHVERVDFSLAPVLEDLLPSHEFPIANQVSAIAWSDLAGEMYLATTDRNLFIVNRDNGEETILLGETPFLKGIAFDGATLYGLEDGLNNPESLLLHTLNSETGASLGSVQVTLDGQTLGRGHALARDPGSGALFAIVEPVKTVDGGPSAYFYYLVTLDPATGAATFIVDLADRFTGLAFLPSGALLGVTDEDAFEPENLYLIDTLTGARSLVTTLADGDEGKAIAVADGILYIASGDGPGRHYFQRADPSTLQHFITDIPFAEGQSYGIGDREIYALGWSDALQTMFASSSGYDLWSVGIESPTEFAHVGYLNDRVKGIAFDGATCYAITNNSPPRLMTLNTTNASEMSSVDVSLSGFTVNNALGLARRPADGALYAVLGTAEVGRILASLDTATGAATILGALPERFAGIAFRADSTLIGVTGDGASSPEMLFRIEYLNAADSAFAITPLFHLGAGDDGEAIAIAADGFLYHASGNSIGDQYYERVDIDKQTIAPIAVNASTSHSFPYDVAFGMGYSSSRASMYITGSDGGLWRFDRNTGDAELVGYFTFSVLGSSSDGGGDPMKGLIFDEPFLPEYAIARSVVAGGGGVSTGELAGDVPENYYVLTGVIGQHDAHVSSGGIPRGASFEVRGGFFRAPGPEVVLPNPCAGDTNGDGVVDFIDLNNVLSAFGAMQGQPGYIPGADLNRDAVVDFIDLNIVLSFFGTNC